MHVATYEEINGACTIITYNAPLRVTNYSSISRMTSTDMSGPETNEGYYALKVTNLTTEPIAPHNTTMYN